MKPGAGPVTATRSIKKELKNILDENRDKEYLKNHEHAGAIKTKSLNGKALPVMMFSSPKKVNVRRTAVRPIKKSGSVVEDQEGLLGEDWEKKAYVAPSIAAAKEWKEENVYRGGKARLFSFDPSDLDDLGPGVSLYFYIIRTLSSKFFVATLLSIPLLYFCNASANNNEMETGDLILRDPFNLNFMSIATLNVANATLLPWRDPSTGEFATIDPVSVGYIAALGDYLIVLLLSISAFHLRKIIQQKSAKHSESSISIEEYAVFVQGMSPDTTREELKEHFESLFSVDKEDWTFDGYCCGCLGRKRPRDPQILDRGVIMAPQMMDDKELSAAEEKLLSKVVQKNILDKFHRVPSTEHNMEGPSDVIGSCIAEVSVARRDGDIIRAMTKLKATTLNLFRAKARVKKYIKAANTETVTKKQISAKKKLEKARESLQTIDLRLTETFEILNKNCKIHDRKDCVGAFVVFNNEISADRCIDDYRRASWCNGILYPKTLMLGGKKLKVKAAPPPSDILWENIEHSRTHLCFRRMITVALVVVTLAVAWVITQQSTSLRQQHAANTNLPSFKDCSIAGNFHANNTYDLCRRNVNNTDLFCTQCYCIQGAVIAHKSNGLKGMFDFALNDDECSTKDGFAESYVTSQVLSMVGAVIIVAANQVLRAIMKSLSDFEQYKSVTSASRALAKKFLVAQFVNTAVVILAVNAALGPDTALNFLFAPFQLVGMFNGEFEDFSKEWFSSVGTPLLITLALNIVTPHIAPLLQHFVIGPLRRRCLTSRKVIQRDVNVLQAGPQFEITTRSAQLLNHLLITMIFGPGMPLLYPIACLAFLTFYYVDLFLLLRFYQRPPSYNTEIATFSVEVFQYAIWAHLAFSIWTFGNTGMVASQSLSEATTATMSAWSSLTKPGLNLTVPITNSTQVLSPNHNFGKVVTIASRNKYIQNSIFETFILRVLRGNSFPLFFVLCALVCFTTFSSWFRKLWKLISGIFCPGLQGGAELRFNPPLTGPYFRPLDPLITDKEINRYRRLGRGWEVLLSEEQCSFNVTGSAGNVQTMIFQGVRGSLAKKTSSEMAPRIKRTWEVIKESGLHTYDIAQNPHYSDVMKLLQERRILEKKASLSNEKSKMVNDKRRRHSICSWDSMFVCCATHN